MNGNPKCFFDWKDIGRVSTPGGDLDKAKMMDVLKDFKKRFAASVKPEIGLLRCKEDFDSIYHESCTMQPKTMKTEVCCCLEQSVRKAGEKKCKEVEGAEKEKFIFLEDPILRQTDSRIARWFWLFCLATGLSGTLEPCWESTSVARRYRARIQR